MTGQSTSGKCLTLAPAPPQQPRVGICEDERASQFSGGPLMRLPLRTSIGKYELVEFLGGGMWEVYRARDTIIGRTVTVKILTEEAWADKVVKVRFMLGGGHQGWPDGELAKP